MVVARSVITSTRRRAGQRSVMTSRPHDVVVHKTSSSCLRAGQRSVMTSRLHDAVVSGGQLSVMTSPPHDAVVVSLSRTAVSDDVTST